MQLLQKFITSLGIVIFISVSVMPVFGARASAATTNLIPNASFETPNSSASAPQSWQHSKWGTNTSSFIYLSTGHTGSRSVQTKITAYSSGDAKWESTPVTVTGGTAYDYSDAYQATTTTRVVAEYQDASGKLSYTEYDSAAPSTTWAAYNYRLVVPVTASKVTIFHLLASVGSLTIDDVSLRAAAPITPPVAGSNLIANASFETANGSLPQYWSRDSWGTNSPTFSYVNTGHTGAKSTSVTISNYTSGDAKWLWAPVSLAPNTTYSYSDYSMSNVTTSFVAEYQDINGNLTYAYLGAAGPSSSWTQNTLSFSTPAGTTMGRVFHLIDSVGTLSLDDVSLTQSSTAPQPPVTPNTVPNPSLETPSISTPNTPAQWYQSQYGHNTAQFDYATTGHTGSRSGKVTVSNYVDGGVNWAYSQEPVTAGKEYVFSDYYQSNVTTQALVAVGMQDGSTQYLWLGNAYVSAGGWSHFYQTVTLPVGAVSAMTYHTVQANGFLMTDDYSFQPYAAAVFSSPMVSLTFDDGIESQYKNAAPILSSYNFKATYYIATSNLGVCDPTISTVCYMTNSDVVALSSAGNEIGSHTVTHPYLTSLTTTQLQSELKNSQDALQLITGKLPTDFAAPYGAVDLNVLTQVAQYYTSQRGVRLGYNDKNNFNQQNLLVQDINSSTTTAEFNSYIDHAVATNTWLILMYHDISPSGATDPGYNTTPADFAADMAYLSASGVPVKTIDQALPIVKAQL
jgi:peptidoglycan/xylan/chitin deacetylase (PgdA/CDA1 family)